MDKWNKIPDQKTLEKTVRALKANGIEALIVENRQEAKNKVLSLLPKGSEVFTMQSGTLDTLGLFKEIDESGNFDSIRAKFNSMDSDKQKKEMKKMGGVPDYTVGSVHAVTMDGKVLIASNSGSQLPAYAYGADHVIWVVGAQKIVKNMDEAILRIYEHSLPLESERLKKIYGIPSFVSKILIFNREINPDRLTLILVKESLGF